MLLVLTSSAWAVKVEVTSTGAVIRSHRYEGPRRDHDDQEQRCVDTIIAILEKYEAIVEDAELLIEDIRAAPQNGDVWKIIHQGHDHVIQAIEQFSASSEVDNLEPKLVLTADCLDLINGRAETPEFSNKSTIIEGDMEVMGGPGNVALIQQMFKPRLWPNPGRIPYCFSSSLAQSSQQSFKDAIIHIQNLVPCLQFVEVTVANEATRYCSEKPGIFVKSDEGGCFASLGQNADWYPTKCNLQKDGCDTMGTAVHEIGHNLGMFHEQSRDDHDQYVRILWQNIQENFKNQYDMAPHAHTGVPYDLMSVMHYSDTAFGKKTG